MQKVVIILAMCSFAMGLRAKAQNTFHLAYDNVQWDVGASAMELPGGQFMMTGSTTDSASGASVLFLMKLDAAGNILWTKGYHVPDHQVWAKNFKQTGDQGFVIAGDCRADAAASREFFVIKTDGSGTAMWAKKYAAPEDASLYALEINPDNSILLTGDMVNTNNNSIEMPVLKLTPTGAVLFAKKVSHGTNTTLRGQSVFAADDGDFLISGTKDTMPQATRVHLMKFDAAASLLWAKTYSGPVRSENGIAKPSSDNGFILTGITYEQLAPNSVINHAYLLKTDGNGDIEWSKMIGSCCNDAGFDVVEDSDNGFVLMGTSTGFVGNGLVTTNLFMAKTNSAGAVQWLKYYGGDLGQQDIGSSLQKTQDGGFLVGGESNGNSFDAYLVKTDALGNVSCNGYDFDYQDQPFVSTQYNMACTVSNTAFTPVSLSVEEFAPDFEKKMVCVMDINENDLQPHLEVYPNPSGGVFRVEGLRPDDHVEMLDVSGRVVTVYATTETLNISQYPDGIYFLRVRRNHSVLGIQKILVRH